MSELGSYKKGYDDCKEEILSVIEDIKAEIKNHCSGIDRGECKYCSRCNMLMGIREILSVIDEHIEKE